MNLRSKTVVVTGGAGFIGSHLVDRIIDENPEKIFVLSNYFLGKQSNLSEAISRFKNLEIVKIDVGDHELVKHFFENNNVDVVFNLAVIPLPTSLELPSWTFSKNVNITSNICEMARQDKFKTLIHFSSSEVYGTSRYAPMDEKHPLEAETPYAASKVASDSLVLSYNRTFNIDCSIVRPFNNYGPRQNAGKYAAIIPLTIRRIMNNDDLVIYGDGEQTRDFIYVKDTANAAIKVHDSSNSRGKVLNVASGKEISMNKIVKTITALMNYNKEIIYKDARPGDVRRHLADISLAKQLIEFEPKASFEEGIKETVEWYKKNMHLAIS
ncbi:MAG TPA: GDP-mannose 4,6-dehydratase [Candidatus Nanoarchaeia archaeon]|nr:GDP-mannose 4,6-dehydratase [Candidatus Nanoarchaeia archaeon]